MTPYIFIATAYANIFRRIFGPHICGDGIDIDVKYDHILTSSWRRENVLQVRYAEKQQTFGGRKVVN